MFAPPDCLYLPSSWGPRTGKREKQTPSKITDPSNAPEFSKARLNTDGVHCMLIERPGSSTSKKILTDKAASVKALVVSLPPSKKSRRTLHLLPGLNYTLLLADIHWHPCSLNLRLRAWTPISYTCENIAERLSRVGISKAQREAPLTCACLSSIWFGSRRWYLWPIKNPLKSKQTGLTKNPNNIPQKEKRANLTP